MNPRRRERKDCRAISGIPGWRVCGSSQSARTEAAGSSVTSRRPRSGRHLRLQGCDNDA